MIGLPLMLLTLTGDAEDVVNEIEEPSKHPSWLGLLVRETNFSRH